MAALLACVQWALPHQTMAVDLACIIALGLPHGALDVEVARNLLVPCKPRLWFPLFGLPYLALAFTVLALWRVAPLAALFVFLALSVWHFGETPGAPWWQRVVRGGAPVALPVLLHPALTAGLLSGIAQTSIPECPAWLVTASLGWAVLSVGALALKASAMPFLRELAVIGMLYAILPPLTALAIYFVCLHSPAHMREMIDRQGSARVTSMAAAWRHAVPPTLLTVAIGAMLWPWYTGAPADRLLALTLQGLAALTVPHMLMDPVMSRLQCHLRPVRLAEPIRPA